MLYREEIEPSVLAGWIRDVKSLVQVTLKLPNVPVGTADTWTTWVDGRNVQVWEACDVVLMNAFPVSSILPVPGMSITDRVCTVLARTDRP